MIYFSAALSLYVEPTLSDQMSVPTPAKKPNPSIIVVVVVIEVL